MQSKLITQQQPSVRGFVLASGSRNDLPPTNFTDTLLAELFPDNNDADEDILAPFDYQAFLRKEGLI